MAQELTELEEEDQEEELSVKVKETEIDKERRPRRREVLRGRSLRNEEELLLDWRVCL